MSDNLYELDPSIYDEYIDTEMENRNFSEVFNRIRDFSQGRDKIRVLDLCCGTGIFPRKWLVRLKGVDYLGLDINKSFVDYAINKMEGVEGYNFLVRDVVNLKLEDKFDVIIATSSYHHILDEDKLAFLKNVFNFLEDEGIFVVYEKLVSKFKDLFGAVDSATRLYVARIKYMLKTENLTEKQIFALFNEMYLSSIRKEEYKVNYEYFVKNLRDSGLSIFREIKMWPSEDIFDDSKMGDFVFVIKKVQPLGNNSS